MSDAVDPVEAIANAVLYEGYLLYPYRPSAVKNRVRWTFGGVYPRAWSEAGGEPWQMRAECLALGGEDCRVDATIRFLHLLERRSPGEQPWQEATERSVRGGPFAAGELAARPVRLQVRLPAAEAREGDVTREWAAVEAEAEIGARALDGGAWRLTVLVSNVTPLDHPGGLDRQRAVRHAMASTHVVLRVGGGELVSLADPPEALRAAAAECRNVGAWPALVGPPGSGDTVLASPIILEDHPRVATQSPGDLFDATEIDELLSLRILTLSEEEKAEMRRVDERVRRVLERTEALTPDELLRLHGTVRRLRPGEEA